METRLVRVAYVFIAVLMLALMPVTVSTPESPIVPSNTEHTDSTIPSAHPLAQSGFVSAASPSTEPAAQARLVEGFGKLPLYFVENQGQLDERVAYTIQGSDKTIYFASDGVTFALTAPLTPTLSQRERERADSPLPLREGPGVRETRRWSIKLDFVGANPNVRPLGQDKTEAVISYFKGPQDQWHAGLPTYGSIIYPDLWPGIDLVYYGTVNQLKYEFVVQPGADPAQIRLAYRGADVSLNAKGQLLVTTPIGGFSDDTPVAYQEIDGQRVTVQMEYALDPLDHETHETTRNTRNEVSPFAPFESFREFAFQIAPYDLTRPLILDPMMMVYCGFIGGSAWDEGRAIAVDRAGNACVTGYTESTEASFPVTGGPDLTHNGGYDAFVAKVKGPVLGTIASVGRHLERDGVPFEARGMNYYPKDYAWERFWISYTLALTQTNEELDRAKALGVNAVRIFLPYDLFDGSDQSVPYLGYLADFMGRLQARDMVALVTLFDFYPTYSTQPYSTTDYISSTRHISSVLNTLGVTNTAVLAWDIKNELDRDYDEYGKSQVQAWATEMISYTRRLDVDHLVTLGFYGVVTGTPCYTSTPGLVYSPTIAAEFASFVDVVSMHYFSPERCFESDLSALQSQVGEKPILLEEFGLHTQATAPGNPHTETEQAAYYNALLSLSEAYNIAGYSFWTLNDFSYTLPGVPNSEKCLGVLRNSLVNTCQVTTTQDYTAKPAAETVRRHYADYIIYLDLFDGWVDPNTEAPPAGWTDNWQVGGAYLRGYKPSDPLWSHDLGKVALSKFVSNAVSITGTALSPSLANVNVDRYPILAGQVYSYSVRDSGHDSILYVGVKEGAQITPLLTIMPTTTLPITFAVDLRQPPLNWSGNRTFNIALQLVPQTGDGYSASYEFDWIGLLAAPKASFAARPTIGIAPMAVAFTNTSIGDSIQSQWSFGDGVTSTLDSPTHTYMTRGGYIVTLAINGLGGIDTLTRTNYITVYAPVHAGFVALPITGVAPITVTFANTSTGDYTTSLWSFGDGITSVLTSPTHIYSIPGIYTVTLTVSGPGGTDTLTHTNYITVTEPPPAAGFTATPTSGVRPLAVIFTDTSTGAVSTWLWNFGDDVTSTEQHPTHTYTVTGVYTVTLTVNGPGGSDTESKISLITVRYGAYLPIVFREYAKLFDVALSLDGVDDYASALDSASLDLGTGGNDDFTIETFFYVPDLADTSIDTLVWKPGAYGLYIVYDASTPDQLVLRIWLDSTDYVELYYDVDLSVGWHHVAAVFDNETTGGQDLLALYLDGSLAASNNQVDWTPGLPDSTSDLNIGGYLGLYPVAGWIEEMRLSDIVRYSGISYTVPTDSFENDVNTRALWHFNEAPGSTVFADSSGNGNTLTGQNGAHTGSP